MNHQEVLTTYTSAFIDELSKSIKHVVISPGSRSTPISLLFVKHPDIEVHVNIDERSAAFYALGIAKATAEPVALVCTSGTAAANYYPAVVEANLSRIPLIVITSDRPHELRDVGAPQAIDQMRLYGNHVKWFSEMAIPEMTDDSVQYVRNIARRSGLEASSNPKGPVHLNFPVREPLLPDMEHDYFGIGRKHSANRLHAVDSGKRMASSSMVHEIVNILSDNKRGIIVCGEVMDEEFRSQVVELAQQLQYPILADPLSQLRQLDYGVHIIDCYDTFLRVEEAVQDMRPDVIIRFGAVPVSKALTQFMKKSKDAIHIIVDGGAGWRDPIGLATYMVYSDEASLCESLIQVGMTRGQSEWLEKWQQLNQVTKQGLISIQDMEEMNEGKVFTELSRLLPKNTNLFIGNSMPIRDCDTFFFCHDGNYRVLANRGANGIDGIVSTALGVSVDGQATVLIIGDLSFFHDLNGLLAAKMLKRNITIIVINNDGGGIFSFLPQAKATEKEHFEHLFGTPHGLDFSHVVTMYGGIFDRVQTWSEFEQALQKSFITEGLKVIEVVTNREENVVQHRKLWNDVTREIILSINGVVHED